MANEQEKYTNPRIDHPNAQSSAEQGRVYLDFSKSIWVSTMLVFGTVGSALTITLESVILFFLFTGFTLCFGHSLGMHRRFIHRSYNCPKWMEYFFVHLGTIVGLAGPFGMLKTHDMRDWAQRQTVCHPYFSHGKKPYYDAYWQIFCSIDLKDPPAFEPESEIADDWVYIWMEKTWMLQQLPWALLFYFLGGWSWVFWGVCSRVSISIFGHWLIGYFAHNSGGKDWYVEGAAVQGHNIPWTAIFTMGENWHNNHHAFPESAKLGLEKGQWDPGWWMLIILSKVGLVSDLVTPDKLPSRPELIKLEHVEVGRIKRVRVN